MQLLFEDIVDTFEPQDDDEQSSSQIVSDGRTVVKNAPFTLYIVQERQKLSLFPKYHQS